jgi:hypothetical protein
MLCDSFLCSEFAIRVNTSVVGYFKAYGIRELFMVVLQLGVMVFLTGILANKKSNKNSLIYSKISVVNKMIIL